MEQIVLEPERKILDAWSRSEKYEFRFHSPGSNYCEPCPWLLSAGLFNAGCKLFSFKSYGVSTQGRRNGGAWRGTATPALWKGDNGGTGALTLQHHR